MHIIEKETTEREYGFNGNNIIVDSDKHGRLLIMDGFGGLDSPQGGSVRFRHGMVVKLKKEDTLDSLKNGKWNDCISLMGAVCQGYDNYRLVLDWDGYTIQGIAKTLGLIS